jgi:hypothetical protein
MTMYEGYVEFPLTISSTELDIMLLVVPDTNYKLQGTITGTNVIMEIISKTLCGEKLALRRKNNWPGKDLKTNHCT